MDSDILCLLLVQRIPPEQFQLHGDEVVFIDPERNNKIIGSPNESPYDTPENRAIVADVIANYTTLEAEYLLSLEPTCQDLRRAEMPTEHDLIVALWEDVVEGRPEAKDTLQIEREAIKIKYPK